MNRLPGFLFPEKAHKSEKSVLTETVRLVPAGSLFWEARIRASNLP